MNDIKKNDRVMVTGGTSMIGSGICDILVSKGVIVDPVPHKECDLLFEENCDNRFKSFNPDYVIHAAGYNGGIKWNKLLPSTIFERNVRMGINILNSCVKFNVKKVVTILTSCAYPDLECPLKEEMLLSGEPHPSIICHSYAKRSLFIYGKLLNQQHKLNVVSIIFNNCYGPKDNFDLDKTKFAGALVRKFIEAKENNYPFVEVWGTGNVRRELLYSHDASLGAIEALSCYEEISLPLNIGWGIDFSIKRIAEMIKDISGYQGEIVFNPEKPEGQKRKILDVNRMVKYLPNYFPSVSIKQGLKNTIEAYEKIYRGSSK